MASYLDIEKQASASGEISGTSPAAESPLESLSRNDYPKLAAFGVAGLILYTIVRNLIVSASKPLWFDEIGTWVVARQPSISSLWGALKSGADGNPPALHLIDRLSSHFIANQEIAFRLPSILGYCITLVCIFVFVRRRSSGLVALFCAYATLATSLAGYAIEGRPYSLVVSCIALALVCYQKAPATAWTFLMAVSLMFAQSLHYYAFFALFPFALAEGAVFLRTRSLRLGVWVAFATTFVPFIAFWPLMKGFKDIYGGHFWNKPTFYNAVQTYPAFLKIGALDWGWAIIAVFTFGMLAAVLKNPKSAIQDRTTPDPALWQDFALVLGFLSLPFVAFVVTKLGHGGMVNRYVLYGMLAFPIGFAHIIPRMGRRNFALLVVFVSVLIGYQELSIWSSRIHKLVSPATSIEKSVASTPYPDLPVIITGQLEYLELAHYASPEWNRRFVFLLDEEQSIAHLGQDSAIVQIRVLSRYAPLHMTGLADLANQYPRFLLYSHHANASDWWPATLLHEGYSLQVLTDDSTGTLYLVTRRPLS